MRKTLEMVGLTETVVQSHEYFLPMLLSFTRHRSVKDLILRSPNFVSNSTKHNIKNMPHLSQQRPLIPLKGAAA